MNHTKYGIECRYGNFSDDTSYEWIYKYCHGWWMSSSIGQNPTFRVGDNILRFTISIEQDNYIWWYYILYLV